MPDEECGSDTTEQAKLNTNRSISTGLQLPFDIVTIGFVLGHGGDAAQMLDLAVGMSARGKRVKVIVPRIETTERFAIQAAAAGIDVERSPLIRADPVAPVQVPQDLAKLFSCYPGSLLHLHTGDFCLSRTVTRVMGEVGILPERIVVTVHSPYDTLTPGDERATAWANAAGSRIRYIVCPSRHSLQTQLKYGVPAKNLVHIPNGVDINRYRCGNAQRIREELELTAEEPLLVFTSRLDSQKRPGDALAAFLRIEQDYPRAHIAFVGTGSMNEALRHQAQQAGLSPRVHIVGHRGDVRDWLAAATVWLLPTESENFSLAILEALAAGCAILSTDCSGNDEVLVSGENALLHQVGEVDDLTAKLRQLLDSAALRSKLSAAAQLTSRDYSSELMVARYAGLYDDCMRANLTGSAS